jgi:hypothetical protein
MEEIMQEAKLHDLVLSYRASGKGREYIMERVAAMVYDSYGKYGFDSEDDAADALLKFKRRIYRLVDRFEDQGLSFDVYLATNLRYLARTVRRERIGSMERESVCERAVSSEMPEYFDFTESLFESITLEAEGAGHGASRRRPRARGGIIPRCPAEAVAHSSRLVFLAVKCAWEIDDEGIARIASAAGVGRDWLAAAVGQARCSLESERSRVEHLVERRNASWTRLRLLEARLADESDHYRRQNLSHALEREWGRYSRVKADLASLKTIVSNSLVARILGVPKGTVDSGLYYLRRRFGPRE